MNMRKYQEALTNLEQLHWHLNVNGGPCMWTAEIMQQFKDAINDDDEYDPEEVMMLTNEPPNQVCTICRANWVDANDGYDTCAECLAKM